MEIASFLGRLHPVVVHLPIGFILMAAAFDLISYSARFRHLRHAVAPALFAGFVSAVIACAFGYLLSLSGSYDEGILASHRNAGIALAIASGIWWGLASGLLSGNVTLNNRMITLFGFAVVLVLSFTGHQGGSLTHGSDYLSFSEPDKPTRARPATVADALVFDDIVLPILERRCEGCHRRGKRKGELIVSTYAELMKGGKDGVVIVAGNLAKSELYRRITLDPEDKDFMPTDGKKPLTNEETDIIKWWIEKAHASGDAKVASVAGHEQMLPVVASVLGLENTTGNAIAAVSNHQPNADIPSSTDMGAIGNLRKKGMMVRVMLHAPVMLDVTLPANSDIVMKDLENDLRIVSKNIVWLNLSQNNLSTPDLHVLKEMSNLEKLRLERNPVGDDLVDVVKDLRHLEALNINDTKVSDTGYARLQQQSSLKRIYRWSSHAGK